MTTAAEQKDHLSPKARQAIGLSREERISYIRKKRWVGYAKAIEALDKLEMLYSEPKSHRMPCMLLVSDTNNGKTTILQRFLELHPPSENPEDDYSNIPVLFIQSPPVPDEGRLYNNILDKVGGVYKFKDSPAQKKNQVIALLKGVGTKVLMIDEIHDVLCGKPAQQYIFRTALKQLSNDLMIPIVCAGVKEALNVISADSQLINRFKPTYLPKWKMVPSNVKATEEYFKLLSTFEMMLPLAKPSGLTSRHLAMKIHTMSEGLIGEMSDLLKAAAIEAVKSGKEQITEPILSNINWITPDARKHVA